VRIAVSLAVALAAMAAAGCAGRGAEIPTWRGPSLAHQLQIIREAEAFMADYARLLLSGDRAAIAALYDPDGAILVRNGQRIAASRADMVQRYARESWQPPVTFAWRNLHFEAVGADAVVVLGEFAWGAGDLPRIGTYNALLRREEGRLFIRIEDEALLPNRR
jgi:ketosteroid isomerase-like protein